MKLEAGLNIHNKFKIVVKNAETGQVEMEGKAENIVLNRLYDRVCNFNTYFSQIVFGIGSGTPTPERTTLFNRIGNKSAETESLILDYPTSIWTRKVVLGTEEFNGQTLTEVGISETSTNINTHAMITDAEGQPLNIEKNSLRIIEIYATVYISIYDVDSGLFYYNDVLRTYLTGGSAPTNAMGISNLEVAGIATITGTRTVNTSARTVQVSGRFNVGHLNKDVKYLYWTGIGLACRVPRPGLFEGEQITDELIGVGDGATKKFKLKRSPNTPIENLVIFVNGVSKTFTYDQLTNWVTLDEAAGNTFEVTASYKAMYFPKTEDNVLDISFKIKFDVNQPSPVIPAPDPIIPGETTPVAGDSDYGFFGEVHPDDLINGEYLALKLGLTAGTIQHTDTPWLKFALDGKTLFVAKKALRNNLSWNHINAVDAVYGDKEIEIKGHKYKVRLMKTGLVDPMPNTSTACKESEWNKLMLPIHIEAKDESWAYPNNVEDEVPYWGIDYTDEDLLTHNSFGNGSYSWCQETYSSSRMGRGSNGVSYAGYNSPGHAYISVGWRPVLELVPEL